MVTRFKNWLPIGCLVLLSSAAPARAEMPGSPETTERVAPAEPTLHHNPVAVAPQGVPLTLTAAIDHPELVKGAYVVYRANLASPFREVPFLRSSGSPYAAVIPASDVIAPGLGYAIELERLDGRREAVFASRTDLMQVQIAEDEGEARERAARARLGNRLSVVSSSAEYVAFGRRPATLGSSIPDRYWRIEGGYTYRPLKTVAEFGLRLGVVRGPSPKAGESDLGLNYGAPTVRIRLADAWHVEGELLTSLTEVGFSVGAGGSLLIGDPYGSKLVLGFETIEVFGTRFWSRMDIAAYPRLVLSPIIEATDMPHADHYGVRLLTEAKLDLGSGLFATVLGGYQARVATSGGPTAGAGLAYSF